MIDLTPFFVFADVLEDFSDAMAKNMNKLVLTLRADKTQLENNILWIKYKWGHRPCPRRLRARYVADKHRRLFGE